MTEETMRHDVLVAFEYSYLHDDWVNPLEEALAGVTVDQALWEPGPDSNGIWRIVLHMAVWLENIVARVETGEESRPSEGAWPPLPTIQDEAAWEAAKKRLWNAQEAVRRMIESTPWEKIQNSPYGLPDLLCRITHNVYHLGQITKIRECMDSKALQIPR
jgi:hypothetical protein